MMKHKMKTGKIPAKGIPYKKMIWGAQRLLLSCGIVFTLILLMFLLAKGPAYISFREEKAAQSFPSGLYSQCIHLQADKATADISQSSYLTTEITGTAFELSSDSLDSVLKEYLEQAGVAKAKNIRLLLEGDQLYKVELTYAADDSTVRYLIEDCEDIYVDPTVSSPLCCSVKQMQIYPRVSAGGAYESFSAVCEDIKVRIPVGPQIRCSVAYNNEEGIDTRMAIDMATIPGDQGIFEDQAWLLSLHDTSLQIKSAGKTPLHLRSSGRYVLNLSCIGAARVRGYLIGELLFQNTSTPKYHALAGQMVDIGSRNHSLNVILCRDITGAPQRKEYFLISGEATQMDISGVDPFPDMRMWFRENIYMAPVSLLSIIFSMYGLSCKNGRKKVKPRRMPAKETNGSVRHSCNHCCPLCPAKDSSH